MPKNTKFNKKHSIRFKLVNGKDQNGNHITIYKPVQTKNNVLQQNRIKMINQLSDFQISINGKPANQCQIPEFVLEQIRGRNDLIFNQINNNLVNKRNEKKQEGEGREEEYIGDEEEEWEDEEEEWEDAEEQIQEQITQQEKSSDKPAIIPKPSQQPPPPSSLQQLAIQGKNYHLTQSQLHLLTQVLPKNYEQYTINNLQFPKYDEFGNNLDDRQKYKKYLVQQQSKRQIIYQFNFIPNKYYNVVDNDLHGQVLKGDIKDVEDALNYDGEDGVYEELQDDFFAKLISGNQQKNTNDKIQTKNEQPSVIHLIPVKHTQKIKKQPNPNINIKTSKFPKQLQQNNDQHKATNNDEQITDQMIDKALQQFDKKPDSNFSQKEHPISEVILDRKQNTLQQIIQQRQQHIGKDGQLDWRTLTRKQKRDYMKNKKIKDIYQQLREKQIKEKLQGKNNVTVEQLHLKQYIQHIPFCDDYVMQEAMKREEEQVGNMENFGDDGEDETESDEDDIISYRAKTSIISANLATVQQKSSPKKKSKKQDSPNIIPQSFQQPKQRIKVIPSKRNRSQTAQERRERKCKLKQLKRSKKDQRKEFNQIFDIQKKKQIISNVNAQSNPLNKISHVSIS